METPGILKKSSIFTKEKLQQLRHELNQVLKKSLYKEAITLVTTGSYGRGEASEESDLDWYLIFDKDLEAKEAIPDELQSITAIIEENIDNDTGDTGTFGENAIVKFSEMQKNLGGQDDTNATLTRRMLFLLEGTWLYGEGRFNNYRQQLLKKYIKPNDTENQVPRFLLNDIIRYYRTIATDFEHKIVEGNKAWGLRNTKLRFSRKLLYFSGIIVAAELQGKEYKQRLQIAGEMLQKTPIDRIADLGEQNDKTQEILNQYNNFLAKISDADNRSQLDKVTKENREESDVYMEIKQLGNDFSRALHEWLTEQYKNDHPIHHALIF